MPLKNKWKINGTVTLKVRYTLSRNFSVLLQPIISIDVNHFTAALALGYYLDGK